MQRRVKTIELLEDDYENMEVVPQHPALPPDCSDVQMLTLINNTYNLTINQQELCDICERDVNNGEITQYTFGFVDTYIHISLLAYTYTCYLYLDAIINFIKDASSTI
jgi:hypothetical protein